MTFLAPLWLTALAAIALPILLHLRDAPPSRRIRVGSIADLVGTAAARRRRRLRDPLLLVLRCLLVALLALLLAHPVVRETRAGRAVAVVPIGAERVGDSLRAAGVALVDLPADSSPWRLARRAASRLVEHDTLLVVSPLDGERYGAVRPVLAHAVRALPVAPARPRPVPHAAIALAAASPRFASARDSVAGVVRDLLDPAVALVDSATPGARLVSVGTDAALGLDSAALAAGALARDDFADSLLTRLLPPPPLAPSGHELAPRRAESGTVPPRRDLAPIAWWLVVALFVAERFVAWRRP